MGFHPRKNFLARAKEALQHKLARRQKPLRHKLVTALTRRRYRAAVRRFLQFRKKRRVSLAATRRVDMAVGEYIEHLWRAGDSLYTANATVAGIQFHLPWLHGSLKWSWKLCRAWAKAEPVRRAAPISPAIVLGLAGASCAWELPGVAAGLLLGFDCYLRTGELLALRKRHVCFQRGRAILKLEHTKTSQRKNACEMVLTRSRLTTRMLELRVASMSSRNDLLVGQTAYEFRLLFRSLLRVFDLSDLGLSPYSLRRGGATWDFLRHGSMEKALLRGWWASTPAARVYLQDAAASVVDLQLTEQQEGLLHCAARHLPLPDLD